MERLPGDLLRGKGFIKDDDKTWLFNLVMGKKELKPVCLPEDRLGLVNQLVFIGSQGVLKRLEALAHETPSLSKGSTFDPMSGIHSFTK
jgi:hypothetical protein